MGLGLTVAKLEIQHGLGYESLSGKHTTFIRQLVGSVMSCCWLTGPVDTRVGKQVPVRVTDLPDITAIAIADTVRDEQEHEIMTSVKCSKWFETVDVAATVHDRRPRVFSVHQIREGLALVLTTGASTS